jgi:hypothetical protein
MHCSEAAELLDFTGDRDPFKSLPSVLMIGTRKNKCGEMKSWIGGRVYIQNRFPNREKYFGAQ